MHSEESRLSVGLMNWKTLLPILVATVLIQAFVPLARVAVSYQAVEINLTAADVGVIAASYALVPVILTVWIGRLNDMGFTRSSAVSGALLLSGASFLAITVPPSFLSLALISASFGLGQTILLASTQTTTGRASSIDKRDEALGLYMAATSAGQIIGPIAIVMIAILGLAEDTSIFVLCASSSIIIGYLCASIVRVPADLNAIRSFSFQDILRNTSLLVVIFASALCVTVSDLVLVYLPLLGQERGFSTVQVGMLLGARATVSLISRVAFAPLARVWGNALLLALNLGACALGIVMVGLSLPFWATLAAMVLIGVGVGLGATAGLSLTLEIAPAEVSASAVAVRISANRLLQFAIPLVVGPTALMIGTASVFGLLSVLILVVATLVICRVHNHK